MIEQTVRQIPIYLTGTPRIIIAPWGALYRYRVQKRCQGASWHLGVQILQHGCIGQIAAVACIHNYHPTQKPATTSVVAGICFVVRIRTHSNATVRWTVAPSRLDGMDSSIFIPLRNENANRSCRPDHLRTHSLMQ